jgi:hypothetical protein
MRPTEMKPTRKAEPKEEPEESEEEEELLPWELPKHLAAKAANKTREAETRRSQERRPGGVPSRTSSVLKPTNSRPAGVGGGVIGARVAAAAEYENRLKQQFASLPTVVCVCAGWCLCVVVWVRGVWCVCVCLCVCCVECGRVCGRSWSWFVGRAWLHRSRTRAGHTGRSLSPDQVSYAHIPCLSYTLSIYTCTRTGRQISDFSHGRTGGAVTSAAEGSQGSRTHSQKSSIW